MSASHAAGVRHRAASSSSVAISRSRAVVATSFMCVLFLACYLYIGGAARMSTNPNLPAPATGAGTACLRASALFAIVAGLLAIARTGKFLRVSYVSGILFIGAAIIGTDTLLWRAGPWGDGSIVLGTAVLLSFPCAMRHLTDRQTLAILTPLLGLCGLSVLSWALRHEYFFSWYDRWGLVAAFLVAAAAALSSLGARTRVAIIGVAALSIAMSTSRQALSAALLVALVWLLHAKGLRAKIWRISAGTVAGALMYAAISASQRVEGIGGIANSNGRFRILHSAWSVLSRAPIYGLAGARSSPRLHEALFTVGLGWSESVHNFLLDVWLRGGMIAALAALLFLIVVVWPKRFRGRLFGVALLPFFLLGSELLYVKDTSASILIAMAYGIGLRADGATASGRQLATRESASYGN